MPSELSGFYFDPEKNRYFPVNRKRGRGGSHLLNAGASSSKQENGKQESAETQGAAPVHNRNLGLLQLLRGRECRGDVAFARHFLEGQASHPQVWEYPGPNRWADGALQHLRVSCQTPEGEREVDTLVLGGSNGCFELCMAQCFDYRTPQADIVQPRRCVPSESKKPPSDTKVQTSVDRMPSSEGKMQLLKERKPPGLWRIESSRFASAITSIKRLGEGSLADSAHPQRNAIVTTLGAGEASGSLYVLCLKRGPEIQEWDRNYPLPFQIQARVKTGCSIWTAEASPDGTAASLGMDAGAGLVALERSDVSWLCRSSSSVFSQQFDKTGNILFCGFRNGVISTIDLRKPAPKESGMHHRADSAVNGGNSGYQYKSKGINPNVKNQHFGVAHANGRQSNRHRIDDYFCSHSKVMRMDSAICSLVLLRNDENYLLASAMNGVIQQWDRRMVEKGAVRTYEGHYNTHTTLQLGIDPTETFLVSGGEDCVVRIWSLASGRLLHTVKNLSAPATCICWPASIRSRSHLQGGGYWEEPPFESNFTWGVWFGSSDGLHYMHGASSQLGAIFQLEHPPVNYLAGVRLQETGGIWRLISMQNWQLQVLIMEILQGGGAAIPSPLHFQVTISISNALCSEYSK